ncbi:MAG: hypothetical protein FJZ56_06435 [Chlamydiae bacterium]|nr:hypothetical protein [Chlamydiota bacterium]
MSVALNIRNDIQPSTINEIVDQEYDHSFCSGRICELASTISNIVLATIATIVALFSANFVPALMISAIVWFIAMQGNIVTCWSNLPNLCADRTAEILNERNIREIA